MKKAGRTSLFSIASSLDAELGVEAMDDSSNNGLQVQNSGRVTKVCCGVDASLEFFEAARERGGNLLIVHHGLSWGDSLKRITRLNYRLVKCLMDNDMALYACHLPLDAHAKLGNNILLCRALGLTNLRRFAVYRGSMIGWMGSVPGGVSRAAFRKRYEKVLGRHVEAMDFGPSTVRKVGVVSGGGCGSLQDAEAEGLDTFVSGEPTLAGRNFAKDCGMNAFFGGHYATERFGAEALGRFVSKRFGLPSEFIELGIKN